MKNWLNKMSKEKAQRFLFIGVLILVFSVFFISLYLLEPGKKEIPVPPDGAGDPPDDGIVVYETILMPINLNEYEIIRKFWSHDKSTEDQNISLIVYGSTYFMSKGVSYYFDNQEFEVIACLSGVIVRVTDDPTHGKCVVIDHGNGISSEYMSLSSVVVEEGDEIDQGAVIGNSGMNEYDQDAGIHVHFQLKYEQKSIDPELLFGIKVNEIENYLN